MLIWDVSGNFPTAWACAPGSALPTAHLSLLLLQFSSFILSDKVVSPMLCLLVSLVLLTICLYSKQNTISLCIRSTCSVLLGYSVDLCSLLCMEVSLLLRWFVKPQKLSPRTMVTSSDKKKRLTTSSPLTVTSDPSDLPIRFFQQLPFTALLPRSMACCWHLVHRSGCFHDGVQPERFQLQPIHH